MQVASVPMLPGRLLPVVRKRLSRVVVDFLPRVLRLRMTLLAVLGLRPQIDATRPIARGRINPISLPTAVGGVIERTALQALGKITLIDPSARIIVRIAVKLAFLSDI